MVRKIKSNSNIITLEEFKENESKYSFDVEVPLKSELGLANNNGQEKKIEKLTSRVHLRLSELENEIIEWGMEKENLSRSELVRKLILEFGKDYLKEKIENDYSSALIELNDLEEILEEKIEERNRLLDKRGATEKVANELSLKRNKLKFEIQNYKSDIKHLNVYIDKYAYLFQETITEPLREPKLKNLKQSILRQAEKKLTPRNFEKFEREIEIAQNEKEIKGICDAYEILPNLELF